MWCTDTHADKAPIHIKINLKKKKNQSYLFLGIFFFIMDEGGIGRVVDQKQHMGDLWEKKVNIKK